MGALLDAFYRQIITATPFGPGTVINGDILMAEEMQADPAAPPADPAEAPVLVDVANPEPPAPAADIVPVGDPAPAPDAPAPLPA